SVHGYASEPATPGRSPEMWREYWSGRPASSYPTPNWTGILNDAKPAWMTETSGEAHTMAGALELAGKTLDSIVQSNVGAYVYWQTSMSTTAYDNQALTAGTDKTDKKYNAAKQFFRYIRPGSYRVSATPSDPTGVYVAAF